MNDKQMVRVSKFLSKHLRHAPEALGLTLRLALTTTVIRESWASSVSPTARLSMLKPRDANIPDTCAKTPGWFRTSADRT